MNLLLLTQQGGLAGSLHSIAYLGSGLAKRGHCVVAGIREDAYLWDLLEGSGVIRYPMPLRSKLSLHNMRLIRDAVKQYNIDIINAQSSRDRYTSIFAKYLFGLGAAVVHTRRQKPESIGGFLQRQFYVRGTARIIVVSDELKRTFVKKGFPPNHIEVIYNGLPPERFIHDPAKTEALRKKMGILPKDVVIACVSRRKKQEQLLAALPLLNKPDIKVVFVGIEAGSLDHYVQQYGVKNPIIYAGIVPGDEIRHYYPLFDVHVLPSTMDGFGLALVEAMGAGVPVVATRAQGFIDVLDGEKNGLWFDDGNIAQLATKINTLLTDAELRKRLTTAAKIAAVERFSLEKTLDRYEEVFEQISAKHR